MKSPLRILAAALLVVAAACSDSVTTRPSGPASAKVGSGPADPAALQAQVNGLINALFAPKDQGAIQKQFATIKAQLASGKTAEAQASIVNFVQLLLTAQTDGRLQDPNGAQPPTTADALRSLVNSVAQFGGLPAPLPGPNPFAGDGAVAVVGPAGGTVVSSTGFGGVGFPPGALPANVIVVVARLPNPVTPGAGPLPTALTQYPLYYDFSTVPFVAQFAVDVTVGICQLEVGDPFAPPTQNVADRLQLAHPDATNPTTIELLPRTTAAFVDCNGVTLASANGSGPSLAARALGAIGRLFRPVVAYAVHGGLGGRTRSFSPFGAVDPGLLVVGVCGTPMPNVSQTYPTVDLALANVAPGGDVRICPQTINVPATYLVDKPVTIEADDPQNPPQFVVSIGAGLPAFRVNPVLQGAVNFRSLSFSILGAQTAIALGLGTGPSNQGSWWQVLVENSQFVLPGGQGRGLEVFPTAVPNPKFVFQNNQVSGGFAPILTQGASLTSTIEILSNSFGPGASLGGVILVNEGTVRVEGNTFAGGACGFLCIGLTNVTSGLVKQNTMTIPSSPVTDFGIAVTLLSSGQTASVVGNTITGTGGGGPASSPLSYAVHGGGVLVGSGPNVVHSGTVDVSGNTISNAGAGIFVRGPGATATGSDNVVSNVLAGLRIENTSTTPSSLTIGSSDFTSYFTPVQFDSPASSNTLVATCNWWGTAAGPQNLDPFTPASMYVPWTTAPIANGAGGQCNGAAGTPSISITSVTANGLPVNLANVSGAIDVQLSVQPSGNTVTRVALFLDGNEVAQSTSGTLVTLNTALYCNGPHVLEGRVFTVGGPVSGTASQPLQLVVNNIGGVQCTVPCPPSLPAGYTLVFCFDFDLIPGVLHGFILQPSSNPGVLSHNYLLISPTGFNYIIPGTPLNGATSIYTFQPEFNGTTWNDVFRILLSNLAPPQRVTIAVARP